MPSCTASCNTSDLADGPRVRETGPIGIWPRLYTWKGIENPCQERGGVEGDEEETLETMFLAGRYICRIPTSRDAWIRAPSSGECLWNVANFYITSKSRLFRIVVVRVRKCGIYIYIFSKDRIEQSGWLIVSRKIR